MKTDINLLQKRKGKQYSGKKLATMLLAVVFITGAVYAAFMLPGRALMAARLTISDLNEDLSSPGTGENLAELSEVYAQRNEQLEALSAIANAKADMNQYIDAVEASLPTSANITYFGASEETIHINGTAQNDEVVASFCLHLRQTSKFSSVFLLSSTLMQDGETAFSIELALPVTLDSPGLMPEETADTEATQQDETTEEVTQ